MKKHITNLKLLSLLLFFTASFSSCLKDKNYDTGVYQSLRPVNGPGIVEIGLTATDTSNFLFTSLDAVNKDTVIDVIPVNLASAEPASEDINVTVSLSPQLVEQYNHDRSTNYVVPAPASYSIINEGGVVVIKKGSRTGFLRIKLKPADFIGTDWALGFAITRVDKPAYKISRNFFKGIFAFGIKNKYDGVYTLTGTMTDNYNPALTGNYPATIYLVTKSSNSVSMYDVTVGDLYHSIRNGSSLSYYGNFTPVFTFSNEDKITSVVNYHGQPASNQRAAEMDPSGENARRPDKSIHVKYKMLQNNLITPYRTLFIEDMVYVGPRP